jgi:hypothetical protein
MEDTKISTILSEFYDTVESDLTGSFHPMMRELQALIGEKTKEIRAFAEEKKWIVAFDGDIDDNPAIGVDASSKGKEFGEVGVAIAVGVTHSTNSRFPPNYVFKSLYGASSEYFNKIPNCLKVAAELEALANALEQNCWVFYDGSLASLNFEVNKFAFDYSKGFFEDYRQMLSVFEKSIDRVDSFFFQVLSPDSDRLIAISKKGISRHYADQIAKHIKISSNLPSDKTFLNQILRAGEYIRPIPYKELFGKNKGFGFPKLLQEKYPRQRERVKDFYEQLRVIYFKPWPWSQVLKIEYVENGNARKRVENVMGAIAANTLVRSIMEPEPLYMADLLSKQASTAIDLYGDINCKRYPHLFTATRTSER